MSRRPKVSNKFLARPCLEYTLSIYNLNFHSSIACFFLTLYLKKSIYMPLFYILLFCLLHFIVRFSSLYVTHAIVYISTYMYIYTKQKNSYTYKFVSYCSQRFPLIMEAPLTENAISSLLSGVVHLQPLL